MVILATLNVHKSVRARPAIATAGCHLLFLSRYSPDFNLIEHAFSMLKSHPRAVEARSFETVVTAIGEDLDHITRR